MKNDIRNLYWNEICQLSAGRLSRAPKTVGLLLSKLTLGNNFSVVWIENLSNFKHFHISAMSNNRIAADFEFFVKWQWSLQLVRAVGDLLTGLTIYRARGKLARGHIISWYKQMCGVLLSVAGNYIVNSIN